MGYLWENMENIDVQASEAALTAAENRARNAETELSNTNIEAKGEAPTAPLY